MAEKQTYKILGQQGFEKYDELLRGIKLPDITTGQIDSLFPRIKLVPWSTGTDEEISAIIDGYYNGELTLEQIKKVWHVGDVRLINTSSYWKDDEGNGHYESKPEKQNVPIRIIDFDHDLNAMSGTKTLLTVDFKDIFCQSWMNVSDANQGGWKNSNLFSWCQGISTFHGVLPQYLLSRNKYIVKKEYDDNGEQYMTAYYIFLLSLDELNLSENTEDAYEYYKNNPSYIKTLNGTPASWWTRMHSYEDNISFIAINSQGQTFAQAASDKYTGVAPAFCL